MKKNKVIKRIGCCVLAGSMMFQGGNMKSLHIMAESVKDVETPSYWSGNTGTYTSGGVEWQYLMLHYNGPSYGSSKYEEHVTNIKVVSIDSNVTDVIVPDMIGKWKVKGLGENALKNLKNVKSIKIPRTVERICNNAFEGCSSLERVEFEDISTLEVMGEYIFKDCISYNDGSMIKEIIRNGKIQKGMFENCSAIDKITIEGKNVDISDFSFSGCSNLKNIIISNNVQGLNIGENAFQGTKLEEIEFKCKTILGRKAFNNNYYLSKVVFQDDVSIGEKCFENSFRLDSAIPDKIVEFKKGTISIGDNAFIYCKGLNSIVFQDKISSMEIGYKAFFETSIDKLNFRGKNLYVKDSGLTGMDRLSQLEFHNSYVRLEDEPFYGRYFPSVRKTNECLKKITFYCERVEYVDSNNNKAGYESNKGTFYGLMALKEIVCEEKCKIFQCNLKEVNEKEHQNCKNLSKFYFKNPKVNLDGFVDNRKNKETKLYGYRNSVGSYVDCIKTNVELQDTRNQAVFYSPISSGLTVIYNGEAIIDGNEINTDNLEVYETYIDGTKSERIPYKNSVEEAVTGYNYIYGNYQLGEKDFLEVMYVITYEDSNVSLPVKIIRKVVDSFEITYIGDEKIEGDTVSASDFKISHIIYNDQSIENVSDEEISVELESADRLSKGNNTVYITYKGKTIPYTLTAKAKKIKNLDIIQADNMKKLFEGGRLSKQDFIVTAQYDNGDIVENFKDYTLENVTVKREVTNVTFVCEDYIQSYEYYGIPLKVEHLNVSYNDKGVIENGIINKSDLKVTAVYNSGKEVILKPEDYSFKTYTIIGGKINTVFIMYNDDAAVKEVPFYVTGIKEEKKVTDIPVQTQSPVISENNNSNQTQSPVISENNNSNQTQSPVISENNNSNQTQSPVISEGNNSLQTKPPVHTDDVLDEQAITLKKANYTVGVKEKLKIKLSHGIAKSFETSNANVVTINAKGVITAKKIGNVKIIVKDKNNNKAICRIFVKKAPKWIKTSYTKKTLKVKKKAAITPKFAKGCYSHKITYTSSNPKVAIVSSKGIVTAKKKGRAVITLKTYNNKKAKVIVKVKV